VVKAGEDLRLALEPREALRIVEQGVRENLQGHLAAEAGIAGAVDVAHST
jgi:hypothetical protein